MHATYRQKGGVQLAEKKKKTIQGVAFRCHACGQVFIAGSLGIEPLTKRVAQHAHDNGHLDIPPINPPKGMCYENLTGTTLVGAPFDGKDKDQWLKQIKSLAAAHGGIRPAWKLKL